MSSSDGGYDIPQDDMEHMVHVQHIDEKIFLGIQIAGGHILLPILVLTIIFSRKVSRHPVFINFCMSWIFSSVLYSLLVYRGRSDGETLSLLPSYNACLIQASLLNGVQALTSCTTLALVVHLWMLLRSYTGINRNFTSPFADRRKELLYTCTLIGVPFFICVVFAITTMVIGSGSPLDENGEPIPGANLGFPGVFYCVILQNADFSSTLVPGLKLLRAIILFSSIVSLITVGFEVHIARLVYKSRVFLKKNVPSWPTLFLRVVLFSIYRVTALSLNMAIVAHPDEVVLVGASKYNIYNGVIDFFQAAIPLVAFLVFATEKDILRVWCFWKKDEVQTEENDKAPPPIEKV